MFLLIIGPASQVFGPAVSEPEFTTLPIHGPSNTSQHTSLDLRREFGEVSGESLVRSSAAAPISVQYRRGPFPSPSTPPPLPPPIPLPFGGGPGIFQVYFTVGEFLL